MRLQGCYTNFSSDRSDIIIPIHNVAAGISGVWRKVTDRGGEDSDTEEE
jgi:hypothetical protein